MNGQDSFEKLNKLYKTLLAPTTFLILISWHYTLHLVNLGIEYPQYAPYEIDPSTDLFVAPRLAIFEITSLAISLFSYLLVYFEKQGWFSLIGRFIGFSTLLFTLFLTAGPFVLGEMWFIPVPRGEVLIPAVAIFSTIFSIWLLWRAKKSK